MLPDEPVLSVKRAQISEWIAMLRANPENNEIVAFEMNFALNGDIAQWMVTKPTKNVDLRFEVRDFYGEVTLHRGQIAAIKHIRDKHGWSLMLAKRWCDVYCRDTSTHDEYGRPHYVPLPEDPYVDDQPF